MKNAFVLIASVIPHCMLYNGGVGGWGGMEEMRGKDLSVSMT